MSDYEFRGKRIDNGKWVRGNLIISIPEKGILEGRHCHISPYEEAGMYRVHPETVCNATGLLDKNREKIFKGDIVRDEEGYIGLVYWHKEHASFYWGQGQTFVHSDELEVIGNAYDNPELLEANHENQDRNAQSP